MRIELKGYEQTDTRHIVDLFIEREQGKYNNLPQTVEFLNSEVEGLTKDQVVTKAWLQVKPTALLVFNRVWECKADEDAESWAIAPSAELLNTVKFEIVEFPPDPIVPQPKTQEEINRELMVQNNLMELKIALLMDEMGVL